MNRLLALFIAFFLLNNCSFNENSRIWKEKDKDLSKKENVKKIFAEEEVKASEFNQEVKLNLSGLRTSNKIIDNTNNYGAQIYDGVFKKIGSFKFSKLDEINNLNYKPIFLSNGLIFFDKKGTIIRYDNNKKVLWKKNHYTKSEKKLRPKLNFAIKENNILITDSIAKYYSINVENGELNWSKNNTYPFNSDIKSDKDKIFVVDYKNTLLDLNQYQLALLHNQYLF